MSVGQDLFTFSFKMRNRKLNKPKSKKDSQNAYKGLYSTVEFTDREYGRLFECIPDIWFYDENKDACYWPPKTGKSFTLRALNGDLPDDTWEVCGCAVISEGHRKFSTHQN